MAFPPYAIPNLSDALDRYSASMICRVCRLHPRTLERPAAQTSSEKTAPDFFPLPLLPAENGLLSAFNQAPTDCRVLIERPDGARLTVFLPRLDQASISTLRSDFLRSQAL